MAGPSAAINSYASAYCPNLKTGIANSQKSYIMRIKIDSRIPDYYIEREQVLAYYILLT